MYTLGANMYNMLTGERPPQAMEIFDEGFPVHRFQERQISDSLIACVSRAMSLLKKGRPQSMEEFLEMIRKAEWLTSEKTKLDKDPIAVVYGGPPIQKKWGKWWHNKRK